MTQAVKILTATTWALAILLFTSTSNLEALMSQGTLDFQINHNVQLSELLDVPSTYNPNYIWRKIGHAASFFILTILLLSVTNWTRALTLGILLAITTELLQPIFSRDGRILDMVWDTAGIILALILYSLIQSENTLKFKQQKL